MQNYWDKNIERKNFDELFERNLGILPKKTPNIDFLLMTPHIRFYLGVLFFSTWMKFLSYFYLNDLIIDVIQKTLILIINYHKNFKKKNNTNHFRIYPINSEMISIT